MARNNPVNAVVEVRLFIGVSYFAVLRKEVRNESCFVGNLSCFSHFVLGECVVLCCVP